MMIDAALRMQPDGFDALMQLLEDAGCFIKRGAQISIKPPDGERYIRLDTLGLEYEEAALRWTLAGGHVHIPKIPRADYTKSQVKRLVDIEAKLCTGKGKGYQVWAERNNIDAKARMIIFLKEHGIESMESLNDQIQTLQDQQKNLKSALREKQARMKEINQLRQAIRDYSRTKEVYTQYRESGWSPKFYQEHREEIEAHKNVQAVYSSNDGQMPTLKELTAEYDALKEQANENEAALDELKPRLKDLKTIQHNFRILQRDIKPEAHQVDHHHMEEQR
jgi:prefoldin subunit 5